MKQFISILGILALHTVAHAQTSVPPYKPDARFQKLVEVYNTNDSVAYKKYFAEVLTDQGKVAQNVRQMLSEHHHLGDMSLRKIKRLSATETELTLQTNQFGAWASLLWVTDTAQNYKEHHMRPIRFGTDFLQEGALSRPQILAKVDAYIKNLTDQKLFAGNVLIAQHGKILYNKSFGNNPAGIPNTAARQLGLASMGKLFTTISILQLADQHKLSLDDTVGKLMSQLTNKAITGVTVRQLLTHTSGMGDYFEMPEYDPMAGKQFTPADHLTAINNDKLRFAPGKGFRYSNTGFLLLGKIVEKVSGRDFKNYVTANVLKKAGMANTNPDDGSGGGQSTVTDIYNFATAIQSNKLLKPATTNLFLTTRAGEWGLGQEYQQLGNEVITGHSGGFIGICTELNMYQKSGYTVVILSNSEPPFGHFLSDKIKEFVVRK